eukprot:GHRQ01015135.1.p1 GENE.GHRQ01015135.1~~GHRQ01015135.1.p1  ORF type:complete len:588 (+),score=76.20 GHRQ01015135.1:1013-2776(+)
MVWSLRSALEGQAMVAFCMQGALGCSGHRQVEGFAQLASSCAPPRASSRARLCKAVCDAPNGFHSFRALAQAQQKTPSMFNRGEELAILTRRLSLEPTAVVVLTGPSDTGKSAILQELVSRLSSAADSASRKQVFLEIDCRAGHTTSPASFASHLAAAADSDGVVLGGEKLFGMLKQSGTKGKASIPGFSVETYAAALEATAPLDRVIRLLMNWLRSRQGPPYPVLIIDHASRLRDWQDERGLQVLLGFLMRITHQGLCHVVLGTSDSRLMHWLQQREIGPGRCVKMEVGNLTEDAIKEFVYGGNQQTQWPGMLQRVKVDPAVLQGFTLPEHLWDRAYQLLGGNAGCWKVAVSEAAADFAAHDLQQLEASWQRVFDAIWVEAKGFVKRPFGVAVIPPIGGERPCWTPQQWGEVLGAIADAPEPHHAVPYTALCALVGEEAVWSLLNYGYLTLRTPSALAQDLPPAVFDNEEAVVTASFQAALAYIKTKEWKARVSGCGQVHHWVAVLHSRLRSCSCLTCTCSIGLDMQICLCGVKSHSHLRSNFKAPHVRGSRRHLLPVSPDISQHKLHWCKRCCCCCLQAAVDPTP